MYNPNTPQQNPNTIQANDPSMQGKRQTGSGFTDFGKVLNANTGAGTQMGQQIGQGMGNQAGQVQKNVQQAGQSFGNAYNQARTGVLQDLSGMGQLGSQVNDTGQIGGSGSGLANMSEAQATQMGNTLANAAYKGPSGLSNANQLSNQAYSLGSMGNTSGTSGGQKMLLQSMVANPGQYTRGQSTLDASLLGQSAQAQKAIQGGAQQALQTQKNVGTQQANASNLAQQAGADISQKKGDVGAQLAGNLNSLQTAATTQGAQFGTDATRLQSLMAGTATDANGDPITREVQLTDADKALIDNSQNYGLKNTDMYGDSANTNIDLNNLANRMSLGAGGMQYLGGQQNAAKNLALMTQQGDVAKTIGANKFDTNVFSQDPNMVQTQADRKASDIVNMDQRESNNLASMMKADPNNNNLQSYRDYVTNYNDPYADQMRNELNSYDQQKAGTLAANTKDVRSAILQRLIGQNVGKDYKYT